MVKDWCVENVYVCVDFVVYKFDWFFDEVVNFGWVFWFVNYDVVFGGFFYFGYDNGFFVVVWFVEGGEFFEGVIVCYVWVEYEKGGVVFMEYFFGEFEWVGCVEGFGFDWDGDVDVEFFFVLCLRKKMYFSGFVILVCSGVGLDKFWLGIFL